MLDVCTPLLLWALLWGVGAFVTRAWGLRGPMWVLSGVPAGVVMLTMIGLVQAMVTVTFGWILFVSLGVVLGLVGLLVRRPRRNDLLGVPSGLGAGLLALLAMSALAGLFVLWSAGGNTLEIPSQTWDALFDANAIRWAHESASVNPWHLSQFVSPLMVKYYPSTFHSIGALWMDVAGVDAVVASNVAAAIVACALWPSTVAIAACYLFGATPRVALGAGVVAAGSMGMPWVPLGWGVLWATATAGAFVPLVVAFFAGALGWSRVPRSRAWAWVALSLSAALLFVLHPRVAVIVTDVLTATWMLVRLGSLVTALRRGDHRGLAARLAVTVLPLVVAIPIILFVGREGTLAARTWPVVRSPWAEIAGYLSGGPAGTVAQPLLVLVVALGLVVAARTRLWWMPVMLLVASVLDIATATIMGFKPFNGIARFWYNDRHRTVVVPSTPLVLTAALGVDWVMGTAAWRRLGRWRVPMAWVGAVAICLSGWLSGKHFIQETYADAARDSRASLVSPDELGFFRRVAEIVPSGEIVLNNAKDGSGLLYAYSGVRLAFYLADNQPSTDFGLRLRDGFISAGRTELCEMVRNDGIRWVVNSGPTFAKGVILPDPAPGMTVPDGHWATTPVLMEGDRKLFRITGCAQG